MEKRAILGSVLAVGTAIFLGACDPAGSSAGDDLLRAFQGGCTKGRWTEAALAYNAALVGVLEKLKATKACEQHSETLSAISQIRQETTALISDPAYRDYRMAEESLQELTLALNGATDPELQQALGQALIETQVDLALKRAAFDASTESSAQTQFAKATQGLAQATNSLLRQASGISSCRRDSPAAAVELSTNVLALAGSFVSPVVGAAASVAGDLLSLGVAYATQAPMDAAIAKLEDARMSLALTCGMESLTELHCQADDAFALLELQASSYSAPGSESNPLWQGMDLLGRRLPALNAWLLSLKNGVRPSDPFEAERQKRVLRKMLAVDMMDLSVVGLLNQQKRIYDAAVGQEELRRNIKIRTIADIANDLTGSEVPMGTPTGPFAEVTSDSKRFACWLSLGVSAVCPESQIMESLDEHIRSKLFTISEPTMQDLFEHWGGPSGGAGILGLVKRKVDIEFTQTITADPASLLATALEPGSVDNVSARRALAMISGFLTTLSGSIPADDPNPNLLPLLTDTRALITRAGEILDDIEREREDGVLVASDANMDRVVALFDLFQLRRGVQFFNERIRKFIQWDLQRRLEAGDLPTETAEILLSAGGDIRDRLLAAGVDSLSAVSQDLSDSISLSQSNVSVFRKFFRASIGSAVERLEKAAIAAGEPLRGPPRLRPNRQALARICALTLVSGDEWPRRVPWEPCSTAVWESIYPDPEGKLTLEVGKMKELIEDQPLQKRLCAYHRVVRARRLAEILEIAPREESQAPSPRWSPQWFWELVTGRS
ncbi:MAG: hypothetical protein IT285_01295 [Bdellovibrionales bacterium]|nr:hypothetical protein [Bdellovibrionales bacterium]